jgi:taurine dioxygenase
MKQRQQWRLEMDASAVAEANSSAGNTWPLNVMPITGTFGAHVHGLDLSQPVSESLAEALREALRQYKVLAFDPQPQVEPPQLLTFGKLFGEPETEHPIWKNVEGSPGVMRLTANHLPVITDSWHADGSTRTSTKAVTVLQAIDVPEYGRDTIFADMEAAFDNLSAPIQRMLEGMTAEHSWGFQRPDAPPVEHPVVMVDPANGRKTLYVNRMYTKRILGLRPDESEALLNFLFEQAHFGEYQLRISWKPGTIAMWDNAKTQHYLVRDRTYPRVMHRVLSF